MNKDQEISRTILELLYRNGTVTRPELVQLTGIRPATILYAIDRLKKQGLIWEPFRAGRKTGRKASELAFAPDYMYLAGVDFQIDKTIAVLTDTAGNVLSRSEIPAEERKNLAGCRREILTAVNQLKKEAGEHWKKLRGIGFADPGLVRIKNGFSIRAVNVPGWENVPTGAWLTQNFGVPSGVWPECMVKTFVEYQSRHFSPELSLFHLALGNGIGGGFIKDGKCFIGDNGLAMEIGHVVIDPEGPLCRCGNRGCLEAVAGEAEIRRRIQKARESGVETALRADNFSPAVFAEQAKTDKAARIIATDVCEKIGKALSVVVTLLNPSLIVLSGNLTALGGLLTDSIRNVLNLNCFPGAVENLKIEISSAQPEDTARGAARMMCGKLLGLP